jgi:hypothetical protein
LDEGEKTMATIGTLTVRFYSRYGGQPRVINNVPESQYAGLDSELKSGGGYHTYQVTASDGT